MRSRDSTVASCFVFSVIMSWIRLSEADFFLNAQTLRQSIFFQSLPIVSQQRARFEWLQSSNCELGVARPTELATPIYFVPSAELVAPKKWG
jgi:hypothetical protein